MKRPMKVLTVYSEQSDKASVKLLIQMDLLIKQKRKLNLYL